MKDGGFMNKLKKLAVITFVVCLYIIPLALIINLLYRFNQTVEAIMGAMAAF